MRFGCQRINKALVLETNSSAAFQAALQTQSLVLKADYFSREVFLAK